MADGDNLMSQFQEYANYLDATNEKRERIVKASRDLTYNSKKVIFQTHRMYGPNMQQVLEQAEKDLAAVRSNHVQRIANELQGHDYWKFRRAFSPGVQEFVEAATFLAYCQTGKLQSLVELNQSLFSVKDAENVPFTVSVADYLLGVGDLTGELMRLAITGIGAGDVAIATGVCDVVRSVYEGFTLLGPGDSERDMNRKIETMRQSLTKIENACYTLHVRGLEYPMELLGLEASENNDSDQRMG